MSEHLNWILVHLSSLNANWQNFGGKLDSLGGIFPWTTEDMHFNCLYEIVLIILEYICLNHASHQSACYGVRVSKTQNPCRYPFTGFPLCKCIPTTTFSWEDWNWWAFSTNLCMYTCQQTLEIQSSYVSHETKSWGWEFCPLIHSQLEMAKLHRSVILELNKL